MSRLTLAILAVVIAGTPIVAYLWQTVNELLSGHVHPTRLALALPVLVLFILLLRLIGRFVRRLDVEAASTGSSERRPS